MQPEKTIKPVIQTYADDMAKVIDESSEAGLVKKIIQQEEEYELKKKDLPPELKKNKIFLGAGAVMFLLALGTVSFFLFKSDINTVEVEKQFVPLIFLDKSTYLEVFGLKKEEIVQTVLKEVTTTTVKPKGIEGIYLTENNQFTGLRRFTDLIKGNFVAGKSSLLVTDKLLLGVVNNNTKDFFMLMKVRTTADVFAAMRAWENKMFFDLHGFFGINISPETNYLLTKNFEDAIVGNKNARVLYRSSNEGDEENPMVPPNKIALMYIFADENSVIITNTDQVAREIILRLSSGETAE